VMPGAPFAQLLIRHAARGSAILEGALHPTALRLHFGQALHRSRRRRIR